MEFQHNSNVYTSDGKEAGSLYRVVIDPSMNAITNIVIQSGLVLKDERVIPVSDIVSADQDHVTLDCTNDVLKDMSPLKIEVPVENDASGRGKTYDPTTGGMTFAPTIITETKRTIPEDLVALREGAQVISDDEKHVGNVECVITEPESTHVTHFIVSQGLLTKTRKTILMDQVRMLDDEKVRLNINAQEFENLPSNQ